MQRFVNDPDYIVEDMVKGYVKAHKDLIKRSEANDRVVQYVNAPVEGKVGLVTGGGSGHEPAFLGYVGKNMMDAVAVGEIFSSPSAQAFYDAFMSVDSGQGVACLFGNYAGDNMNVKMAIRKAKKQGVTVKYVVATDDVASSPKETKEKRHGIAGGVFMWKIGGAKAALGGTLDEVIDVAQKTVDNTRSICVGLSPCAIPAVGHPNFQIEDGTMEVGIGHHGEPGINVQPLKTADDIAEEMLDIHNDAIRESEELDKPLLFSKENFKKNLYVAVQKESKEDIIKRKTEFEGIEKYLFLRINAIETFWTTKIKRGMLQNIDMAESEAWAIAEENLAKEIEIARMTSPFLQEEKKMFIISLSLIHI